MNASPIVSLAPSATATIAAMGLTDRLAGVTTHCSVDAERADVTRVGGWLNPSYDRIREIDPAVVCTSDELQREIREELHDRGYDVVHREPARLDDVIEGFEALGEVLGETDAGTRLARASRERLDAVETRVADRDRPVVYCEEWSDPPMAAGNWVPDAVRAAGGRYPFVSPGERSREIRRETVENADPDHAVLHVCGHGDRVSPDRIAGRGWGVDPEIHVVDDSLLNQPSPRLLDGIELLSDRLHPED
ncbi:iron complex transport system substrate-binding protein [Halalkaliarchaeum desulfuricum]|uniref:Iron complex transport system substrate-binding protein n=1 Tax=Halalkaliarchaeum desulfuricum TaxID=2055893 RepID=A0A343TH94_9EURY|nr:helical backbone metal receptor [Halalkaliarchaeum desulfuricum]AUX08466.1 iron complex transport system substrate-binding protein [Halalkaliarchaeum desulfuricum]